MALRISTRLVLVSTVLLLVWGGSVLYLLGRSEVSHLRGHLTETLESQIRLMVPGITEQVVIGNYDMIERMLAARAQRPPVAWMRWHDVSGPQLLAAGTRQAATAPAWFVAWAALPVFERAQPIAVGGLTYGEVAVALDPAGALDQVWQELATAAGLLLAGIGTLLAAIVVVTRASLRPLDELNAAARRFGEGDYAQRADAAGAPEMVAAAQAFNGMAQRLECALASLRESELRWQFALEGAGDGVWDWDLRAGRIYFSARWKAMLGYAEGEIGDVFQEWQSRIHGDDLDATLRAMARHLDASTEVFVDEHRLRRKDGGYRWFLARGKVVERDDEGAALHMIGTHTDITARRQADAELRRHRDQLQALVQEQTADLRRAKEAAEAANREKSLFLANMSHELRTPMHAMLAFAQIGRDRGDERTSSYFERIRTSGERLSRLLNDLLDLSNIEAGRMTYTAEEVDLHETVTEVSEEMRPLLGAKRLTLAVAPPPHAPRVTGDPARLAQVVRNIVANAIRYSPEGGRIDVAFNGVAHRQVEMTIADQGVGIPEQELETIFDKFVQSSATRTKAGGTGLGLAICREIVRAHKGRIRACNGPQGGAVFHIVLPGIETAEEDVYEI